MQDSKGFIFIISGPSGVGKSTLVNELLKINPMVKRAITFTTRPIRKGEVQGVDYNFIDLKEFETKKDNGYFLETIKIFDHYYGTDENQVREILKEDHCILVLDPSGALEIMQKLDAVSIFIQAKSLDILNDRMLKRQSETLVSLDSRLDKAKEQMKQIKYFDYIVTNDTLGLALKQLDSIIVAQQCKNRGKKS